MAAGFVYLVITVPLTHLVNHIDTRLRVGRKVAATPDLVTSGTVRS